jgi:hypothetical protein
MRLIALTLIIILALYTVTKAQDVEQNLSKYWQYRNKLVTQYMLIGDGQGYSLPASYINPGLERMKWSDNTIWLGWYMGTLATEFHLLHNPRYEGYIDGDSARIEENLNELYYALRAIIRLDSTAETSFTWNASCGIPNARNGFFIRDDVPANFTDSFPGYNFVDSDGIEINFANEMSQDQVYHVLLGLSLYKKFIPDTLVINGMNIHDEAVEQARLIGEWVHQDGWIIKNPACGNKDVDRGPDVTLLAKGFNSALNYISDGTQDYSADVSSTAAFIWDQTLINPAAFVNVDNLHMTLALAAIGEGWGSATLNNMMTIAESNRWYAYPLLYIALRDTNAVTNYAQHKQLMHFWSDSMLNEAPITGPLSTYPNQNGHGYGVNNRFIRPRANHYAGINPSEEGHQWNGLDYMLLHNLQLIVDPNKWPTEDTTGVVSLPTLKAALYPNPAAHYVNIVTNLNLPVKVAIYDLAGSELLMEELDNGSGILLINNLGAGTYLVKLTTKQGQVTTQRLALLNR